AVNEKARVEVGMLRGPAEVFDGPRRAPQPILEHVENEEERVVVPFRLEVGETQRLDPLFRSRQHLVHRKGAKPGRTELAFHVDLDSVDLPENLPEERNMLLVPVLRQADSYGAGEVAAPDANVHVANRAIAHVIVEGSGGDDTFHRQERDRLAT